jgi:hypothetical protein
MVDLKAFIVHLFSLVFLVVFVSYLAFTYYFMNLVFVEVVAYYLNLIFNCHLVSQVVVDHSYLQAFSYYLNPAFEEAVDY